MKESPLFARSYDFICWLIPQTTKFPREQRFIVAARLQNTALDFMESLYMAGSVGAGQIRRESLQTADVQLKQLRFYLRLSHDLKLMSTRRYEHACRQVEEIGRLLGGWIKKQH